MHLKFVSLGGGSNPRLPFLQPMHQHDTTNWYRRYQVTYHSDLLKGGATGHIYAPTQAYKFQMHIIDV